MTDYTEVFNFVPDPTLKRTRSPKRTKADMQAKIAASLKKRVDACTRVLGHTIGRKELDQLVEMVDAGEDDIKAVLVNALGYLESDGILTEPPF